MAEDLREDPGEFYPGGTVLPGLPTVMPGVPVAPSPEGEGKAADAKAVYDELEKKQNKLKQGENITIASDGTISASGGDVDVVAEIAGKEIEPSQVVMKAPSNNNSLLAIKLPPSGGSVVEARIYSLEILDEFSIDFGLGFVNMSMSGLELKEKRTRGSYGSIGIDLNYENLKTNEERSFSVELGDGVVYYAGPEGEAEKSIYDWINGGGEGTGEMLVETTWEDLVSMRDNGELIAGMQYRITDYVATTVQEHTQSANHPFDIIVTADSPDKLNEVARAICNERDTYFPATTKFEAWKIWYSLDNDTNRFEWADEENGKGVIYRMIDEFDNDVPYDFKGIKMQAFLGYDEETGEEKFSEDYRYTFGVDRDDSRYLSVIDGMIFGSYTNKIKPYYKDIIDDYWNLLSVKLSINFITFGLNCAVNTFDSDCYNNTFGQDCYNNTFDSDCYNNTFDSSCYNNTFGSGCGNNAFGVECYYNTCGLGFCENVFGMGCGGNTFGSNCCSNIFNGNCYNNTFGLGCVNNTFGENCAENTFGISCLSNALGSNCLSNIFGAGCFEIIAEFPMCCCEVKSGVRMITLIPTSDNGYEDCERFTVIESLNTVVDKILIAPE